MASSKLSYELMEGMVVEYENIRQDTQGSRSGEILEIKTFDTQDRYRISDRVYEWIGKYQIYTPSHFHKVGCVVSYHAQYIVNQRNTLGYGLQNPATRI